MFDDETITERVATGAAMEPLGNQMLSNMGPASYANRADRVDLTFRGEARIVPLRADPMFHLNPRDPNPIGMAVVGADGMVAGTVHDVWVDRAEPMVRYYELTLSDGSRSVLLPQTCVRVKAKQGILQVKSILAHQFRDVPAIARPDRITLLEEDKIQAYYAGGYMYATPQRSQPLI